MTLIFSIPSWTPLGSIKTPSLSLSSSIAWRRLSACLPLKTFRKVFPASPGYTYLDEELLHHAGAVIREGNKYIFNNAEFLFFSSNPQRVMSWAYVCLLRFEAVLARASELGLVSDERKFTGPLPTQIRNIRAY